MTEAALQASSQNYFAKAIATYVNSDDENNLEAAIDMRSVSITTSATK